MNPWGNMLEMQFISRVPTASQRDIIGELSGDDWAADLRQIRDYCPELLTPQGQAYIEGDDQLAREMWNGINDARDRERKMGRYAPLISLDEMFAPKPGQRGSATERQIAYLRQLGVREQDHLLGTLTKKEASELIDAVLKLREENGL